MNRYVFYFLIALLVFEIFSIINYLGWNDRKNLQNINLIKNSQSETDKNYLENAKTKQSEFVEIKLKDLPCEDKILQIVWNKLTNEIGSINSERARNIKNCSDIIESFFESPDLNNDGQKEIFIRGVENPFRCGNNCSKYWVFEKINGQSYRKIFEANGYLPVVRKSKTLGYKNIAFEFYASAIEFIDGTYKFNGTEYVLKNCWSENKLVKNKDGDFVKRNKWKVKNYDCREIESSQK
ncbi:MAG TPA: hypothetical protein PKY82_07660 [Pyrinomonadaceae bacterium]|nr:hypothetical protein [Pyrinomonadaceae bacterium]